MWAWRFVPSRTFVKDRMPAFLEDIYILVLLVSKQFAPFLAFSNLFEKGITFVRILFLAFSNLFEKGIAFVRIFFSSSSSSSSYQPYGILCTKIAFATLVIFKQSILTKLGLNKVPMPKLYAETFRRRDVIRCHVTMS